MSTCVQYAPMIGAREGELSLEEARGLAAHLAGCASCRALAADFAATEGILAEALLARADRRDFAPFVDEVMARVQGRRGLRGAFRRWWLAAGAATVVVALAAVAGFMYVQRGAVEEPEQVAALEVDLQGATTILQTSDGPVVLLEPDDETGS